MKKEEIENFSFKIEDLVIKKNISYMDAIVLYCEETELEIEIAAKLISYSIKQKIKEEAENLNFLPKEKSKLPL